MRKMTGQSGFTLIELLIAATIFMVVMTTITAAFRTGVFGYDKVHRTLETQRLARQVLQRMRHDLKNLLVFSQKDAGFSGKDNAMGFTALVDVFKDGAWVREYAMLSYVWDGKSLARTSRQGKDAMTQRQEVRPESIVLPGGQLTIHYGKLDTVTKNMIFTDEWTRAQGLPSMVRIELILDNEPFESLVYLPQGRAL